MKQGLSNVTALMEQLQEERKERRDYIADTRRMEFHTETDGDKKVSILTMDGIGNGFEVSELAHRQIADRLKIPFRYYEKMRNEFADLLDRNVNAWLREAPGLEAEPDKRMVRTLHGKVRAFLSDRYRRLDNLELAIHVLPVIAQNSDNKIASMEITDNHMYLKVISDAVKDEIVPGDVVKAGFTISNSEVGLGCLRVEPLVYRLVCTNGMILPDRVHRKYHTGRQVEENLDNYGFFREETLRQDDKAYFMKVQDIVRNALDEQTFAMAVKRFRDLKDKVVPAPIEAVKVLGDTYQFTKKEIEQVTFHFIGEQDLSQFGLVNAVTRTANDIDNYERATDFERMGGTMLYAGFDDVMKKLDERMAKAS